jgi:hypothetical protein
MSQGKLDLSKYPEEQEELIDEILLNQGYTKEQLKDLWPEEKEDLID